MIMLAKGGLIVSCQARADNPLHGPAFMAAMALAAEQGGAVAIRANGPSDIRAVKAATRLPVVGIHKIFSEGETVTITPSIAAAEAVMEAGADIVALDFTFRRRSGDAAASIIEAVHAAGRESFADVSTLEEGVAAEAACATYVATTLAGYTVKERPKPGTPDLDLVRALARTLSVPVIAEGRYDTPALARAALEAGAHAVVVGTMITNPREITRSFVSCLRSLG